MSASTLGLVSRSRPPALPGLTDPVRAVPGVGEKRAAALEQEGIETVEDLLLHIPRLYLDRRHLTPISQVAPDTAATVLGTVRRTNVIPGKPGRFEMMLGDDTGFLRCTWFGDKWMRGLRKRFAPGDLLIVSGKVSFFNGKQLVSPEYDILTEEGDDTLHTGRVIPVYRSSAGLREAGLDSRGFRRIIKPLLDRLGEAIPETLPEAVRLGCALPGRAGALYAAHFPETPEEAERARARLAFDELFYMELLLALRKYRTQHGETGIAFQPKSPLARRLVEQLPFELTPAQKRVLREIHADMCRPRPMNRLLQGDVGAGKTVVAAIAMLLAVESGYQAALMAPTEILAEQHALVLKRLLDGLDVPLTFLTGGLSARERQRRHEEVASGAARIVVGTHALIQEAVAFHRLGLAVIDEQHRFGVAQRALLREKGAMPDVLVMTATPIPRTLALTVYGDLDVSVLDALPPGRKPIATRWTSENARDEVYAALRAEAAQGRQAYVVCPLVEESEKVDLKAAVDIAERLQRETFPDLRVGLLHGRMKSEEKDGVMQAFKAGAYDILVSTTVIEVGIDVPNATMMVIEQAERFGLAQLHQLRGRIGRGEHPSACILINGIDPGKPVPDDTLRRLQVMTETQDGFRIADEDLQIRGPGEFLGTRQHGLPGLRIADVLRDSGLLHKARETAFALVAQDPRLEKSEHRTLRAVLARQYADVAAWIGVG
jgi:ATP-dependent DNA helicase RecG